MLSELKFVQGAVAKKDLVPALTHFVIDKGRVRGFNGTLALCSPIALDITCKPKAAAMVSAIANCVDTVQMNLTAKGRLTIKSGPFKANIDCIEEDTVHVEPEGESFDINGVTLLAALKAVWEFVGDDASRPWTNGVLLSGQSVFATNNVCLVQYWIGTPFPHVVNLPRAAVREMIRINEAPVRAQMVDGNNITFHYANERWVRTQLLTTEWPDLNRILAVESVQSPIDERIFKAMDVLKPFIDKQNRVYLYPDFMSTHENPDEGDTYDIPGMKATAIFSFEMLSLLKGIAKTIDLTSYPKPSIFMGENLRGAIVGMRL